MKLRTFLFIVIFALTQISYGCTIIMVSKNGIILTGNNEDWRNPKTKMWFIPANNGEYGRICFGFDAKIVNSIQSVTKSFTSAVMGIAIEQGKIKNIDEKVLDFFPAIHDIENMDDRKASMKFRDLFTMRSGTDYDEGYSGSPHSQLIRLERGWDRFYLTRPMGCKPGTRFRYDSGGVILMSAMLKNRTGLHVDAFAEKTLFAALGIKKSRWIKNREGHSHTGGGLYLRPLDMAKFGLLYLRHGKWENKQVVPEWWVKESFKKQVTFNGRNRRRHTGYGYLWWIQEPDPEGSGKHDIYSARDPVDSSSSLFRNTKCWSSQPVNHNTTPVCKSQSTFFTVIFYPHCIIE